MSCPGETLPRSACYRPLRVTTDASNGDRGGSREIGADGRLRSEALAERGGFADMRRFLAAATALLLLLLGSQAVLAQYDPTGPVGLSDTTVTGGSDVTVTGSGFAPNSEIQLIIESDPVLLATVTADATGAFSATVTIPPSFSGDHLIVATGVDPAGSLRVLGTAIVVEPTQLPRTNTDLPAVGRASPSDPLVIAGAGVAIVLMTTLLLAATLRRRSAA